MSILVNKNTNVLVQGITGKEGSFHTLKCLEYGTNIVAGVTPFKGKTLFNNSVPVYNTIDEAKKEHRIDATMVFVPAGFAASSIIEAVEAEIPLIVCITEGIPVMDMLNVKDALNCSESIMIGPNCPGIITADECKIGIMPGFIHKKGKIGVLSRSGTLTYEAVNQLTKAGLGETTCIGIGGDPIIGSPFITFLKMFENDSETKAVVMIGEIGGTAEEEASEFVKKNMKKPVIGFIAGKTAPAGKRMGHAGAIISGGVGTASEKLKTMEKNGVFIADNPSVIAETVKKALNL
ncbi:MAG: succinate--CoA ligase subunit alpha [Deltaproteobacteria bacterium]|nr:succinate--CoA ligase subunit alpha [Deltaproteobacteria bacterium]MCL5892823.1 succinate--CoA ligase subunit alpha [Deltaproteobacteria bacterium]